MSSSSIDFSLPDIDKLIGEGQYGGVFSIKGSSTVVVKVQCVNSEEELKNYLEISKRLQNVPFITRLIGHKVIENKKSVEGKKIIKMLANSLDSLDDYNEDILVPRYLARCQAYKEHPKILLLYMEKIDITLKQLLDSNPQAFTPQMMLQLYIGVMYMTMYCITPYDLHLDNVGLINNDSKSYDIKLIDFGLYRLINYDKKRCFIIPKHNYVYNILRTILFNIYEKYYDKLNDEMKKLLKFIFDNNNRDKSSLEIINSIKKNYKIQYLEEFIPVTETDTVNLVRRNYNYIMDNCNATKYGLQHSDMSHIPESFIRYYFDEYYLLDEDCETDQSYDIFFAWKILPEEQKEKFLSTN